MSECEIVRHNYSKLIAKMRGRDSSTVIPSYRFPLFSFFLYNWFTE